jgi:hypothetical protein
VTYVTTDAVVLMPQKICPHPWGKGQAAVGVMSDIGVYVVAVTNGSETRYWAAAVPQHRALDEVQRKLAAGWRALLTDRRLTPEQIAELKIGSNSVQELTFIP